ncbi:hypothetical protein OQJ25_08250 [Fluoribacter dumoffii]|uniref:hypothetical protein n=1 Tax=Fluoribacter dumoffii TaxID=463 RepID=UPI0022443F90|nr:hypothetical protein [Fluoribacter dumoffii]MCW8497100.1 hypothetical protein [Fluoribacter dumoffii]
MTPLFPNDNEYVHIMQGNTGDCYLLATLDCYLNTIFGGRALIKSMFTENNDGSVTVRLPRNKHSRHLIPADILKKYRYHYDATTGHDVFTIDRPNLKRIDDNKIGLGLLGVSSDNCLAVKILEHLSAYYFPGSLGADINASALAHNNDNKPEGRAAEFVTELLGAKAHYTSAEDIKKINRLHPSPLAPATYIEINYGQPDAYGVIHGRHALRIKYIEVRNEATGPITYYHLVNPWDNKKIEIISEEELQKRNPYFCILALNDLSMDLYKTFLKCSDYTIQYIHQNPLLYVAFLKLQMGNWASQFLNPQQLEACVKLHAQIPYFNLLQDLISTQFSGADETLMRRMLSANGDKRQFFRSLLERFPQTEVLQLLLSYEVAQQSEIAEVMLEIASRPKHPAYNIVIDLQKRRESEELMKATIEKIKDCPQINEGRNKVEIEQQRQAQLHQVNTIFSKAQLKAAEYPGFASREAKIREVYEYKIVAINRAADIQLEAQTEDKVSHKIKQKNNKESDVFEEIDIETIQHEIQEEEIDIENIQDELSEKEIISLPLSHASNVLQQTHEAKQLIETVIEQIHACPNNNNGSEKSEIEHQRQAQLERVNAIVANPQLRKAEIHLGFVFGVPSIEEAYRNKIAAIHNAANDRIEAHEARKHEAEFSINFATQEEIRDNIILSEYSSHSSGMFQQMYENERLIKDIIAQINACPHLNVGKNKAEIELQRRIQIEQLDAIVSNPRLKEAQNRLGFAYGDPRIDEAYRNKNLAIYRAAIEQKKFLDLVQQAEVNVSAFFELYKYDLKKIDPNILCAIIHKHREVLNFTQLNHALEKNGLSLESLAKSSVENAFLLLKSRVILNFTAIDLANIYDSHSHNNDFVEALKETREASRYSPRKNIPGLRDIIALAKGKERDICIHIITNNPVLKNILNQELQARSHQHEEKKITNVTSPKFMLKKLTHGAFLKQQTEKDNAEKHAAPELNLARSNLDQAKRNSREPMQNLLFANNKPKLRELALVSVENCLMLLKSKLITEFSAKDLVMIYCHYCENPVFKAALIESRQSAVKESTFCIPSLNNLLQLINNEMDVNKEKKLFTMLMTNPTIIKLYLEEQRHFTEMGMESNSQIKKT